MKFNKTDSRISPLITNNFQLLNHIFTSDVIGIFENTAHNYNNYGLFCCSNINFPRKIRLKDVKTTQNLKK